MANVASALDNNADLLSPNNASLSAPQQELLTWHYTLGHMGFDWLKELVSPYQYKRDAEKQDPIVKTKQSTVCTCTSLQCQSYLLANRQHSYHSGTHTYCDPELEG
eukprot:2036576-Ditylum_brightwellii.AAC.1